MAVNEWVYLLLLGGFAGAIGQVARVIVGIKKLGQEASALDTTRSELLDTSRLVISIVIGFTAGALAAILAPPNFAKIEASQLLALAGAGYAGADFIEGATTSVAPAVPGTPPRAITGTLPTPQATAGDDTAGVG